jgi:hypothetical protein
MIDQHTCTGRKSLAAAIMFWANIVIHSTCRCQSGVMLEETAGGGANNDVVKVEYVRSIE